MSKLARTARSNFEIKMDTLDYMLKHKEPNITRIMYDVNLSWLLTTRTINDLIKSKCIEKKEHIHGTSRALFNITTKGIHALKHYKIVLSELK